jgi:hypothetical protein
MSCEDGDFDVEGIVDLLPGMNLARDDLGMNPVEDFEVTAGDCGVLSFDMPHVHLGSIHPKGFVDLRRGVWGYDPTTLKHPRLRIINFHDALLPKVREM